MDRDQSTKNVEDSDNDNHDDNTETLDTETVSKTESVDERKPSSGRRWPEPIGSIRDAFKIDRRGAEFQRLINDQFSKSENPYETAIYLTEHSPDILQPKINTMSLAILKDFSVWIRKEDREQRFSNLLNVDIQRRAFSMATRRHTVLLKTAVDVFHLMNVAEMFVDDVRNMTARGLFREAAECATALGIQRYFGLNEILIPCILQDKVNFVEPYLQSVPELQHKLVETLDQLCSPQTDIEQFLRRYQVSGIRKDKLCLKSLQKLVARLSKLYNIPTEKTPNLASTRSYGTLKYLLHRRYDEKAMHDDNWHDMVRQGIETCPYLLDDLFDLLCYTYNDLYEAAKWAGYFGVNLAKLPQRLQKFIDEKPEALFPENGVEGNEITKPGTLSNGIYLTLPLLPSAVIMVDDERSLNSAMNELESASVIGVDAEWQTGFGQSTESVTLLQVATSSNVFLLDILTLRNSLSQEILKNAMRVLFDNDVPRKLGFGIGGDMKTLCLTLPYCRDELSNLSNVVCVNELMKQLLRENQDFLTGMVDIRCDESNGDPTIDSANQSECARVKFVSSKVNFSLAELCQYVLGKPLDKAEQYSNWSRRPLRWHQVRYAALDAYCLLLIFEKLSARAVELRIDFEAAVLRSLVKGGKHLIGRDKQSTAMRTLRRAELLELVKNLNQALPYSGTQIEKRPAEVRVVADSMLQGLGRHLRRCGIDCVIAENHASRETVIEIAKKEQRLLLTSGNAVPMAASRLPSEFICAVPSSMNAREQLAWLLRKMRIRVTEEDIFSRCMICNCAQFIFMDSRLLRIVYDVHVAPNDPLSEGPFDRRGAYKVVSDYTQERTMDKCESTNGTSTRSKTSRAFEIDDQQWIVALDGGDIDLLQGLIMSRWNKEPVRIQIETIPAENAFDKISMFYVCCDCGKIYWDGTHTNRYVSKLRDVVDIDCSDSDKDIELAV